MFLVPSLVYLSGPQEASKAFGWAYTGAASSACQACGWLTHLSLPRLRPKATSFWSGWRPNLSTLCAQHGLLQEAHPSDTTIVAQAIQTLWMRHLPPRSLFMAPFAAFIRGLHHQLQIYNLQRPHQVWVWLDRQTEAPEISRCSHTVSSGLTPWGLGACPILLSRDVPCSAPSPPTPSLS